MSLFVKFRKEIFMRINGKPRVIIWVVSGDGRFLVPALEILSRQFNGLSVLGVTATQKISVDNLPFIALNEISLNGGGV